MRINADSFVGVGICILGLVGVGYAIGVHSKMKVMCDRLEEFNGNLQNVGKIYKSIARSFSKEDI